MKRKILCSILIFFAFIQIEAQNKGLVSTTIDLKYKTSTSSFISTSTGNPYIVFVINGYTAQEIYNLILESSQFLKYTIIQANKGESLIIDRREETLGEMPEYYTTVVPSSGFNANVRFTVKIKDGKLRFDAPVIHDIVDMNHGYKHNWSDVTRGYNRGVTNPWLLETHINRIIRELVEYGFTSKHSEIQKERDKENDW